MFRDSGQIRSLGKELTDQAVGVFVRASLPRTVGIGKIDLQRGFRRQSLMVGKLLPVVQRQRLPQRRRHATKLLRRDAANRRGVQIAGAVEQKVARLALDQRNGPAATVRADQRVALPIAVAASAVHDGGTARNARRTRNSPAIVGVFPLPAGAPQVATPMQAGGLFAVNPSIDRLVRKLPLSVAWEVAAGTSSDLVGRPPLPQPFLHVTPRVGLVELANPRLPASRVGLRLGRQRRVAARTAVTSQFAGNRAGVSTQPVGDLPLFSPVVVHLGYDFAFLVGKMMGHRGDSVQKGDFLTKTTLSNLPAMFSPIPVFHPVAFQF